MQIRERLVRRRPDPAAEVDAIAALAERLAVLLTAGVPASAVWTHAGAVSTSSAAHAVPTDDDLVRDAAASAAAVGRPVSSAITAARRAAPSSSGHWAVVAAAWEVASASGAPLATSLRELGSALRDEAQLRREVRSALAGPIASARLVLALPFIAVLFGAVLGFDTFSVLIGNPIGLACVVAGAGLLWAGRQWSRSLTERATRSDADEGLELELLAIAMSGGASVERARRLVCTALEQNGAGASDGRASGEVIEMAARAGAPVAELLRAEAARLRRLARAEGAARAAALGVRLMLPLGACVLPAFVLLGVVPLLVSVVSATLGGAV
ncbi:type II secretion system F family protein [Agromyces sp. Soil535]|uniref:type II secretion system F family protein n=1 Tax=Agromyces sp. Soil535 TaxID=1736390 RepID=UPI000AA05237|nr:type II secretion system F family protein [Agromyces sp. Soil535]